MITTSLLTTSKATVNVVTVKINPTLWQPGRLIFQVHQEYVYFNDAKTYCLGDQVSSNPVLIFDIQNYIGAIKKIWKGSSFLGGLKLVNGPDGEQNIDIPINKGMKKNVLEYYGFATGIVDGSFLFLKIGSAIFWTTYLHGPKYCEACLW